MPFKYNARGVKPQAGPDYSPVPDGKYLLKVKKVEKKVSSNGNDMVVVDSSVDDSPQYLGKQVRTFITFLPPDAQGAGRPLHFLKCIGEPYQGDELDIDEKRWIGKSFYSQLRTKDVNGTPRNYCYTIEPGPDADPSAFVKEPVAAGTNGAAKQGSRIDDDEPPF